MRKIVSFWETCSDNVSRNETCRPTRVYCALFPAHWTGRRFTMQKIVSFWETCSDNVSQNETCRPTRVHNTLLSVEVLQSRCDCKRLCYSCIFPTSLLHKIESFYPI
ncbi:hypothetical protein TVAG_306880 [Trichomonas vaginalis G3]|uniref:Uncharacterized protein n=1 Tax=Trichomonas vaginalis (strain ATCC PRA-98 / G3) TaxID=412133 RepID=A2GN45_TRIV3|nr:hypothetical protein TVAG_306880 [Trichomonas vaginalis G3]|eukprot:XP_001294352.1 hypothetical protein [Trichomonas vaginalis G3]